MDCRLTDDAVHAEEQVVGSDAADMRAERVADTGGACDGHPGVPQERQELGDTVGHRAQVVDGGGVAGDGGQLPPIYQEHIVSTDLQVCCHMNKQRNLH